MTLNIVPLVAGEAVVRAEFKRAVAGAAATITNTPFGEVDSTRRIFVYVYGFRDGSETISGMTIGGVTASLIHSQLANLQFGYGFIAHVPNGTSGTIACTSTFASTRHNYAVYALYGKGDNVAFDTASTGTLGAPTTSRSVSIDNPANGVIIGMSNVASTWSGVDEDGEVNDGGFGQVMSCAHREFASAQTNRTVSISHGSTFSFLMVASFGP
jgi:hypothetical protein